MNPSNQCQTMPPRDIPEALDGLSRGICVLEDRIQELVSRLAPLLVAQDECEKQCVGQVGRALSNVAGCIEGYSDRVLSETRKLDRLLAELQI